MHHVYFALLILLLPQSVPLCAAILVAGNRTRRQTSLLCLGDDFITTLVNGVLDANRETLRKNEPNPLGTCQEYGIFKVCEPPRSLWSTLKSCEPSSGTVDFRSFSAGIFRSAMDELEDFTGCTSRVVYQQSAMTPGTTSASEQRFVRTPMMI